MTRTELYDRCLKLAKHGDAQAAATVKVIERLARFEALAKNMGVTVPEENDRFMGVLHNGLPIDAAKPTEPAALPTKRAVDPPEDERIVELSDRIAAVERAVAAWMGFPTHSQPKVTADAAPRPEKDLTGERLAMLERVAKKDTPKAAPMENDSAVQPG